MFYKFYNWYNLSTRTYTLVRYQSVHSKIYLFQNGMHLWTLGKTASVSILQFKKI